MDACNLLVKCVIQHLKGLCFSCVRRQYFCTRNTHSCMMLSDSKFFRDEKKV